MSIFTKSVLNSIKLDESKVALAWANYQQFLSKKEHIKGFKEEEYQDGFLKDVFENCLGYTLKTTNPSNYSLEREKKNETDSKKADGVIYLDGDVVGVIELKDQKTKNLDQIEAQAFNYHNSHAKSRYIIISNFDELRFYIDKKTAYEKFSLFGLDYEEFRKLYLLLSYESIKSQIPLKLKEKTNNFEQQISKELYKDFSIFRNHLFENIVANNPNLDKSTLLRLTQKLCDRIIFILFAEDRGLLNPNTIGEIIQRHSQDVFGNPMYQYYKIYFEAINKGNDKLQIPKYNGGLFATDELLDSLVIDDAMLDMKAQKLSSYDFESDVSVNILGHIFEQSLTDLEELQANIDNVDFDKTKSKRKKDGVFYTPEYITRYIVQNTLGKLCDDKKKELDILEIEAPKDSRKPTKKEQTTKENLESYRNWLLQLKILDPACGSGAFLNQALEYLISEHKSLQENLAVMGDITAYYEIETSILEHNLYGVDINEDAVEIAKLSLWLRTASKGRELTKLADKIKCGNSLINDKSVVENAFIWEEEFKEVFENGGFDVVIGNPPYGAEIIILNENTTESYLLFYKKAINILKDGGILGFITPDSWLTNNNAKELRKMFCEKGSISSLLDTYKVFDDAPDVWCNIPIFHKSIKVETININRDFPYNLPIFQFDLKWTEISQIGEKEWFPYINNDLNKIFGKMEKYDYIEKYFDVRRGFSPTPNDKNITSNYTSRQIIGGEDFGRYIYKIKPKYLVEEYDKSKEQIEYIKSQDIIGIQRIRTNSLDFKSRWLVLQYFEKGFIPIDSIGYFLQIDILTLKYLQAILSSNLMNLYYKLHYTDKNVKPIYLKKLPIRWLNSIEQEPFIQKADLMIELNKKLQTTKQNFYDELKLEKLTTKLQKFEELEF
ncbi:MAG: N-6 DNA methylase, partial [Arcobacteraceae bacterium]